MSPEYRVAVVIFAAGMSRRMGSQNKLLLDIRGNGVPMVRGVVEQAIKAGIGDVYVVVGYQDEKVRSALAGLNVGFIKNENYQSGISASLRASVHELSDGYDGMVITLGDMPDVKSECYRRLYKLFVEHHCEYVMIPSCEGKIGNPVLWPKRCFKALAEVSGDKGGRDLLRCENTKLVGLEADNSIFRDIDNYEQFELYRNGL